MSSQYPVLNNKPIDQWKVTELKEELRRRKITVRGLKEELVRRLADAIRDEEIVKVQEVNKEVQPDHTASDPHLDVNLAPPENSAAEHINMIANSTGQTECEATMTGIAGQTECEATMTGIDVRDTDLVTDPIVITDCDVTMTDIDINEEANIKDAMPTTTDLDAKVQEIKSNVVSLEDSATESLNVTTQFESSALVTESKEKNQEAVDSDVPCEDTKVSLPESDNQVSVASPDLGSQVKCESIPVDSVSIIEKNKLKDNLNADDFHLEQEVVKPEMVQPSSSYVPSVGADQKTWNDDKGQDQHLVPLGDTDVDKSTIFDLSKKEDILDEDSPEKLNLDRSSSDELIEEDVMENKHIESNIKSDKLVGKTEAKQESIVGEPTNIGVELSGSIPDKKDTVVEDHSKPKRLTEKRKLEDPVVGINEAPKRQRRWNSETVKVPERQPSNVSTSITPKSSFQPSPRQAFTRSDTKLTGDSQKERIVPPSQKPATTSLRIDKFLRPFTLKAVQELLAKTGTVCSFWMDHIKTHCYVTYSSVEEANATRNAVYNLQWPPNGGNHLVAEFVDPQEVKARVEAPPQSPVPISPNPTTVKVTSFQQPQPAQPPTSRQNPLRQQLQPSQPMPPTQLDPPSARERLPLLPPASVPEPPPLTLDDLFKKTKATPRIYYLPLSKEEVAGKLATQGKNMD